MTIMTHPTRNATVDCPDGTDLGEVQELGCTQAAGRQATIVILITPGICQVVIQAGMMGLLLELHTSIVLIVIVTIVVLTIAAQLKLSTAPATTCMN